MEKRSKKTPRDYYSEWGGQRYVLVLLCLIISSFLLWEKRLTSADYAMIMVGVVGAYIAGRAYQKTKLGITDE
jgi:hypothetical protein